MGKETYIPPHIEEQLTNELIILIRKYNLNAAQTILYLQMMAMYLFKETVEKAVEDKSNDQ